jgi:adenosylmethionine-8-amino-7-oxononanoate aminotransferase
LKAYVSIRDAGAVLVRPLRRSFAVSPPLTITREEIGQLADGIRAGLDALVEIVTPAAERAAGVR